MVALSMGLVLAWNGVGVFAQSPEARTNEDVAEADENLEVRYARAHVKLAMLDLKRAEYWNKMIPNMISARTIDFLRKHVEIDLEQLRQSQQEDYADVHQIYMRGAKAAVDLAEADVARKQAASKAAGDAYNTLELDRALAVADVARLNLERTKSQDRSMQTISDLQWQLEELRNQVLELQIQVEAKPE
jgi:hypothetical protein